MFVWHKLLRGAKKRQIQFVEKKNSSWQFFVIAFHLFSTHSEVLYEDENFRSRAFAALVASKVFYHLGAFEESLNYALGAGELFNVTDDSEYVETIIGERQNKASGHIYLFLHLCQLSVDAVSLFVSPLLLPNT